MIKSLSTIEIAGAFVRGHTTPCRCTRILLELIMSATEIIEQIQKLPGSEQDKVKAFFQKSRGQDKSGEADVNYASDAEFDASAEQVLRERANLFRRLAK